MNDWPQKTQKAQKGDFDGCGSETMVRLGEVVSYEAHRFLRHGHLEKIYENSLANRLRALNFEVEQQVPIPVYDEDGSLLGDFYADLLIENWLIIELKACRALCDEHFAQLLGYVCASRMEHGILINFGAPKLQIKKLIFNPRDTDTDSNP